MKGLLIILMVAGHAQIPIHRFIYLFHMSAFFMITGWLFNHKACNINLNSYIQKKVRTLYLPYVYFNIIFIALALICPYIFDDLPQSIWINKLLHVFLFNGECNMTGASWYVRSLFVSSILFCACFKIFFHRRLGMVAMGVISLFTVVYIIMPNTMVGVFSTSLLCIGCGYALKQIYNRILYPINKDSIRNIIFIIIVGLGLLSLLYFTNEEISMVSNSLVNPMYFLCAGILGFVFVYQISTLINRLHIGEALSYCGKKIYLDTISSYAFF